MKAILTSLMVLGLVACLVGAGLFAHFSDVEESVGNQFQAGTLDLDVYDSSGANEISLPVAEYDDLIPCCWYKWEHEILRNVGTTDGKLTLHLYYSDLGEDPPGTPIPNPGGGIFTDPEGEAGDPNNNPHLQYHLDVIIVYCYVGPDGVLGTDDDNVLHLVPDGTPNGDEAIKRLREGTVPAENIKNPLIDPDGTPGTGDEYYLYKLDDLVCLDIVLDDVMTGASTYGALDGEASPLQILVHLQQADDPDTPDVNEANMLQGDYAYVDKVITLSAGE
jgi:predicted ribosomally synthesized peptide with SipW-like signal peptide